jgi:hypothetical protein
LMILQKIIFSCGRGKNIKFSSGRKRGTIQPNQVLFLSITPFKDLLWLNHYIECRYSVHDDMCGRQGLLFPRGLTRQ